MKLSPILAIILLALISLSLPGCSVHEEEHHEAPKITATTPQLKTVTFSQQYVCQIHSQRHIDVRAPEMAYFDAFTVKDGQQVKAGDVLFKIIPILYQKMPNAELAEAKRAQLEYIYANSRLEGKAVSQDEVLLHAAKLARAQANADLAAAELNFATVKAPFDGIVGLRHYSHGSLFKEGEILMTLSDNSVMRAYFNVPEARYLEYMTNLKQHPKDLKIELMLGNGSMFDQSGQIGAIEADFTNESGNVSFRADFPNPERLLRHGQTGTVRISRVQNDAIVIPQRATFEVLQKRYVYVIDKDNVAHQREIAIQNELEDLFVVTQGLGVDDKIVFEGIRLVHDGEKVEYENRQAKRVDTHLKYHAE